MRREILNLHENILVVEMKIWKNKIIWQKNMWFLIRMIFKILLYFWWAFNHQNWEEGKKKSVNMAKFSISDFHYGYQKDRNMII